jgi:NAD(P)-dependent dehydrogenase (short-subunit alcohol dehydrogenase family)
VRIVACDRDGRWPGDRCFACGGSEQSLVERTVAELGKLDILVNNAAYQMTREGIEQIPDGEWEHTFKTNVSRSQYHPSSAPEVDRSGFHHSGGCLMPNVVPIAWGKT